MTPQLLTSIHARGCSGVLGGCPGVLEVEATKVVIGREKKRESGQRWLIMEKSGVKWCHDLKSGDLRVEI